jgi:LysM repeat protein
VQTYKVSASAIIAVNPLIAANPGLIFVGQVITIPLTAGFTTPTPTATFPPAQTVVPTGTPEPTGTPAAGNFFTVVVRAGESLSTYTLRYGVTGSALLAVNPKLQENPGLIFPGQTLIIPVPVSYTPSRTTPFLYAVGDGESAAIAALKFEMTADTLTRANPGVAITPGATILVPAGPRVYTVKPGDELRTIAAQFGTTVEFLLTGNSLPNPDRIYIGQLIFIPVQYNAKPIPY